MYIIAMTGGIASGKSTVANLFAQHGVPVIDTDVIARALVQPGQPALADIRAAFGQAVIDEHGQLNRAKMREIIFDDSTARRTLENILHPRIRNEVQQQIAAASGHYCIVVIPLFAETGDAYPHDRVLVIDVPESMQIQRLVQRDHISIEQTRKILDAQTDRQTRLGLADDVIENVDDPSTLAHQVTELDRKYRKLAAAALP